MDEQSFASLHEAFSKTHEALDNANDSVEDCRKELDLAWRHIKNKSPKLARRFLFGIQYKAAQLVEEARVLSEVAKKAVRNAEIESNEEET